MESLPYRVAGTLLLLYAQPLMKIVALPTTAIVIAPLEARISLGAEPVSVPEPFADMLKHHLHNRPNLRTAGGMVANPWLFPGHRAGKHLDPHTMMMALAPWVSTCSERATPRCRTSSPRYPLP